MLFCISFEIFARCWLEQWRKNWILTPITPYVFLPGIKKADERSFYEIESTNQNWTLALRVCAAMLDYKT
jgi:hypothetical protein